MSFGFCSGCLIQCLVAFPCRHVRQLLGGRLWQELLVSHFHLRVRMQISPPKKQKFNVRNSKLFILACALVVSSNALQHFVHTRRRVAGRPVISLARAPMPVVAPNHALKLDQVRERAEKAQKKAAVLAKQLLALERQVGPEDTLPEDLAAKATPKAKAKGKGKAKAKAVKDDAANDLVMVEAPVQATAAKRARVPRVLALQDDEEEAVQPPAGRQLRKQKKDADTGGEQDIQKTTRTRSFQKLVDSSRMGQTIRSNHACEVSGDDSDDGTGGSTCASDHAVALTANEKQQFHAALRGTSRTDPTPPPHVVEMWNNANAKGSKNKLLRVRQIMQAWRLDRQWGAATFSEQRNAGTTTKAEEVQEGVIWGVVLGMHGGSEKLAQESVHRGDITAFRHPHDPSRMMYRVESFKISNSAFSAQNRVVNQDGPVTGDHLALAHEAFDALDWESFGDVLQDAPIKQELPPHVRPLALEAAPGSSAPGTCCPGIMTTFRESGGDLQKALAKVKQASISVSQLKVRLMQTLAVTKEDISPAAVEFRAQHLNGQENVLAATLAAYENVQVKSRFTESEAVASAADISNRLSADHGAIKEIHMNLAAFIAMTKTSKK